jgi:hypothetical protein
MGGLHGVLIVDNRGNGTLPPPPHAQHTGRGLTKFLQQQIHSH